MFECKVAIGASIKAQYDALEKNIHNIKRRIATEEWEKRKFPKSTDLSRQFSFPRFNDMLKNVRLLIWKTALPKPRLVHPKPKPLKVPKCPWYRVRSDVAGDPLESDEDEVDNDAVPFIDPLDEDIVELIVQRQEIYQNFTPDLPSLATLFVCRESFSVASQYYSKAFGPGINHVGAIPES